MGDLDFTGLRAQVEAATAMPEFAAIQRRARRRRSRSRLALLATVLGTLAVVVPAGVAAQHARDAQHRAVLEVGPVPDAPSPTPVVPTGPVEVSVRAAAGVDLDHVWAAVDVCVREGCNLQLVPVSGGDRPGAPARVGQLRQRPYDRLTDLSLTAFGAGSVVLSAELPGWGRQYSRLDQGPSAEVGADTRPGATARPEDRVVQLSQYAPLKVADPRSGRTVELASQPPLREATVLAGVTPRQGIWVSGTAGGRPAVAVSRDGGISWHAHTFGAGPADQQPVLATADGRLAYFFTLSTGRLREWRSTDAGLSWTEVRARMSWPPDSTGSFGAVVRPDGSLLVWQAGPPATVYLESTDRGATYHETTGPSGAVVQVPGGYVALGERLGLSRDARTWSWPTVPYLVIGG